MSSEAGDLLAAAEAALEDLEAPDPEEVEVTEATDPHKVDASELAVVPADYVEPWSRLEEESDRQWELFRHFREMGPGRSITKVAEHFDLSLNYLHSSITGRFDWMARARAWDRHVDRVYRLDLQEKVKEMAARHANQVVGSLEALILPFDALKRKMQDPNFTEELTEMDFRRLFDLAIKAGRVIPSLMSAERLARGMPTEIVQTEGEVQHIHVLEDVGQLAGVLAVLDRAGAFDDTRRTLGTGEVIDAEVVALDDDQSDDAGESQRQTVGVPAPE
jgi:hypothetical protein